MNTTKSYAAISSCLLFLLIGATAIRAEILLDQSYDAIADRPTTNSGVALTATQSLSQTFTVGVEGVLFQIDAQVASTAPSPTDGLVLDVLEVVNGEPVLNSLGSVGIPLADVPPRFPQIAGSFVSVDVSDLRIQVSPGDVLAFEITHPTNTGAFTWFVGGVDGYSGGLSYFRNPPNATIMQGSTNPNADLGFQTFVQTILEPSCSYPMLVACLLSYLRRDTGGRRIN